MAIDLNEITTDLTLELDEDVISVEDFGKAVESFFGLVREVSKHASPSRDPNSWLVKVYPGSAAIGVLNRPGSFVPDEVDRIRRLVIDGLKQLEKGNRPTQFTDKAIQYSRTLGMLFKGKKAPANVLLWSRNELVIPINRVISAKASELLEPAYEDEGSVEGFLEKLNAHGQFEFVIYDTLDARPIRCEVEESKLKEAWGAFRKRVEVLGTVRYRKDGLPVSVKARELIVYPSRDEIPSVAEIRSLLSET
ncbi:MAG: hypothetical protein M3461_00445 [Pseudomonadota bacterium]|nr:hypothetical protein [Pseudomonadota bacterium]